MAKFLRAYCHDAPMFEPGPAPAPELEQALATEPHPGPRTLAGV